MNLVNNISSYSEISELIATMNNQTANNDAVKEQIKNLFMGSYANMSCVGNQAEVIEAEIDELSELIEAEQGDMVSDDTNVTRTKGQIANKKRELDKVIEDYLIDSKDQSNDKRIAIALATEQVFRDYQAGKIKENEIAQKIQDKLTEADKDIDIYPPDKLNTLASHLSSICGEVTSMYNDLKASNEKVSVASAAIVLLKEMYATAIKPVGSPATTKGSDGEAVFTPEKQETADKLYATYHTDATDGVNPASIDNKQMLNLGVAIGLYNDDGTAKTLQNGKIPDDSILLKLAEEGFSFKEAMTVLEYVFGLPSNVLNHNAKSNKFIIGHGSDAGSTNIANALLEQINKLWNDGIATESTEEDEEESDDEDSSNSSSSSDSSNCQNGNDPIGFVIGNTTYEFVIDRNQDNIFNNASEFLGSSSGFSELAAYDKDGNGRIEGSELDSLMILSTNHENRQHGFMTASDLGLTSINLNSFENISHTNINGNTITGVFDLTVNNKKYTGYSAVDDAEYMEAVYGDSAYGKKFTEKLSSGFEDVKKAMEILDTTGAMASYTDAKAYAQDVLLSLDDYKANVNENKAKQKVDKPDIKIDLSKAIEDAIVLITTYTPPGENEQTETYTPPATDSDRTGVQRDVNNSGIVNIQSNQNKIDERYSLHHEYFITGSDNEISLTDSDDGVAIFGNNNKIDGKGGNDTLYLSSINGQMSENLSATNFEKIVFIGNKTIDIPSSVIKVQVRDNKVYFVEQNKVTVFDKSGTILSVQTTAANGKKLNETAWDTNGNKTRWTETVDGKVRTYEAEYYSDGTIKSVTEVTGGGSVVRYQYDEEGMQLPSNEEEKRLIAQRLIDKNRINYYNH